MYSALVIVIVVLSFAAGAGLRSRAPAALVPPVALAFGVVVIENTTPGQDVPGLGYAVGVIGAALAFLAWFVGRRVRASRVSRG